MRVGLLHTVPGLAPVFDPIVRTTFANDVKVVHLVAAELLALALADDPRVAPATNEAARALAGLGCEAILVTCSSIGEIAVAEAKSLPVPVLRVDEPIAREAARLVAAAGSAARVILLATQPSTLGPSGRLLTKAIIAAGGSGSQVEAVLVKGAAEALAAGKHDEHDRLLRESATSAIKAAPEAAVIALAQASMVAAFDGVNLSVPVLTSPHSGVKALAALDAAPNVTRAGAAQ